MNGRPRRRSTAQAIAATAAVILVLTPPPVAAQSIARTISAAPLEFVEYLPEGFEPGREYPLVVALHGFGASAADWEWAAPAFTRRGVILAAVQAPHTFDRGDRPGRDWFNSHTEDRAVVEATTRETIADLVETLRALRRYYRVAAVYLLGFSQGGRLCYLAGPGQHDLIDGMAIFGAGFDPDAMNAAAVAASAGKIRVFIGHGLSDGIALSHATAGRDFLRRAGYQVTFQSFTGGHELPPPMIRRTVDWILAGR